MKKIATFLGIFMLCSQLNAQTESKSIPLSVGYLGHLGYQPGLKVGTHFDLKNWKKETEKSVKYKSWYVSPQLGFYTFSNVHTGYILNVDFGYKSEKNRPQNYSAISIGLGFLNQAQITERKINLNDGTSENTRQNWGWFLPTLNYELGTVLIQNVGWYSKFSLGYKMAANRGDTLVVFTELGLRFILS